MPRLEERTHFSPKKHIAPGFAVCEIWDSTVMSRLGFSSSWPPTFGSLWFTATRWSSAGFHFCNLTSAIKAPLCTDFESPPVRHSGLNGAAQ